MSHYRKHVFFCLNQRDNGKKCCQDVGAQDYWAYAKQKIRDLKLKAEIRINQSGCLGRCALGPSIVVYPEGVWYTYQSYEDIDTIIEQHLLGGRIVEHLRIVGIAD